MNINLREIELNLKLKEEFRVRAYAREMIQGVFNKYIGERLTKTNMSALEKELNSLLNKLAGPDKKIRVDCDGSGRLIFVPVDKITGEYIEFIYSNTEHEEKECQK